MPRLDAFCHRDRITALNRFCRLHALTGYSDVTCFDGICCEPTRLEKSRAPQPAIETHDARLTNVAETVRVDVARIVEPIDPFDRLGRNLQQPLKASGEL